jgi:hypothetical protein
MIASLRHFLGWMVSAFRSREDLVLENLALHQQLLALHAQRPRRRLTALHKLFWVALRTFLVRVEEASRSGHSPNRRELASGGVSFVLNMDLQSQTGRRAEACQQRGSRLDLPHGCRESDLGSTAHSRRTAQTGFRCLGKECLAMDPASSERSRSRKAMADVPQKPS